MKTLLAVVVLATAAVAADWPQYDNGVTAAAVKACGTMDPRTFIPSGPSKCLMVSVATERRESEYLLVTITFRDSEGNESFAWKTIPRDPAFATVAFDFIGCDLLHVDVEEFDATGNSVGWTTFSSGD